MSERVGKSRFWDDLWTRYSKAPSIAFCRVPELEYAASLDVSRRVLDHSCGDGVFSSLAWPQKQLTAGCDIDAQAIERAKKSNIYQRVDVCDVSKHLPYEDASFDLVFNNSALEHVADVDAVLIEVARILAPGGSFVFNVLNHRYFTWWPLGEDAKQLYRDRQPFYHALSFEEWSDHLGRAGLVVASVKGYFDRQAARQLARLDYAFSSYYLAQQSSQLVQWYLKYPRLAIRVWKAWLSHYKWQTAPDTGAGYFVKVTHAR